MTIVHGEFRIPSFLWRAQRLVFRPGEALLIRGRPSFRERDEYTAKMRAFVALQNAMNELARIDADAVHIVRDRID